jgi:hypothetical protein
MEQWNDGIMDSRPIFQLSSIPVLHFPLFQYSSTPIFYGRSVSGKYLEGAQTLAAKFRQPRMRSSRMMRI